MHAAVNMFHVSITNTHMAQNWNSALYERITERWMFESIYMFINLKAIHFQFKE